MNDIEELYQEMILDHATSPKNFRAIQDPTHRADGRNPLCGDLLSMTMRIENDRILEIAFLGEGCAISKASASLMTETLTNKSVAEAKIIFAKFHTMLTDYDASITDLGKLEVFNNVRKFPMRVKCATLCWHTFDAALLNKASVTTE